MCILSAIHYLELGERASERCPIRFTGETGFFHGGRRFTDDPGLVHKRTLVYLAAGGNIQWSLPTLAAAKCDTVLVSYYDILKNKRWECLRDYVYDPKGTVERDPIFERHLAQIKQHVEW